MPEAFKRIEDEEVKEFILRCLNTAEHRPSAKDLLESKFLNEFESEKNNHEVKVRPPVKEKKNKKKKKSNMFLKKHQGSTILEEEEENSED